MRNYLFLLLLIILASCVKEKDKPDIINHVLESKIVDNLYYSLSNAIVSGKDDCIDIPNSKWTFNKSRYFKFSLYYGDNNYCASLQYSVCWSIQADSLFIDNEAPISGYKIPLYHFKIIELNNDLIKLKRKQIMNIGTYDKPIYKDSIFKTYLKSTVWDFANNSKDSVLINELMKK
jgi:hypothetical protein